MKARDPVMFSDLPKECMLESIPESRVLLVLLPQRHINATDLAYTHAIGTKACKTNAQPHNTVAFRLVVSIQWEPKTSERALQCAHAPLSSLSRGKKLALDSQLLVNLLARATDGLLSLDRHANLVPNVGAIVREAGISEKIEAFRCSLRQLIVDSFSYVRVVPAAWCVKPAANHGAYTGCQTASSGTSVMCTYLSVRRL
jgi:hypothetical protein